MTKKAIVKRNEIKEFSNNPMTRVPIVLCLDTSGSMMERNRRGVRKIDELTNGIRMFYESVKEDDLAAYSADIAIVTFDDKARVCQTFANVSTLENPPILSSGGVTSMGEGVNMALDLLEERKETYKSAGIEYFQPWMVFMTDGYPYKESSEELKRSIMRTTELTNKNKLTLIPVGIGERADMETVNKFSTHVQAHKLDEMKFADFFLWLGKSIVMVSASQPDDHYEPNFAVPPWDSL